MFGSPFCTLDSHSSSESWSLPPLGGIGPMSYDVILVGLICDCVLFDLARSYLSEGQCHVQQWVLGCLWLQYGFE